MSLKSLKNRSVISTVAKVLKIYFPKNVYQPLVTQNETRHLKSHKKSLMKLQHLAHIVYVCVAFTD